MGLRIVIKTSVKTLTRLRRRVLQLARSRGGLHIFGTRPEGPHLKDLAFSGALVPPPPPAEETQAAGKRGCERELGLKLELCRLTNGL